MVSSGTGKTGKWETIFQSGNTGKSGNLAVRKVKTMEIWCHTLNKKLNLKKKLGKWKNTGYSPGNLSVPKSGNHARCERILNLHIFYIDISRFRIRITRH